MRMTAYSLFSAALLSILALALVPAAAQAQTNIAVVNVQKIMRESKAAQGINNQAQSKQKAFQAELDEKQSAFQREDQELAKQRSVLSQEAFKSKYDEFRTKVANAQKDAQNKRRSLEKGLSVAFGQVQQKADDIVEAIAKEKGLNLVVSSQSVLHADSSLDITDDVLSRLNSQLPSVSVNFN